MWRDDQGTRLPEHRTRCPGSPVLYYGRMSSIVPGFTMASAAVSGRPQTLRPSATKQILLLFTATAFMFGALGALMCARDGGSCERPPVTSEPTPFTPLSLAHCPAYCLHGSTLLPVLRAMPDIVVTVTILGAVSMLIARQTSPPPLTPPPRFAPDIR